MRWEEVRGLGWPGSCDFFPRKKMFFSSAKGSETSHLWWENFQWQHFCVLFSIDLWEWTSQEEMKPANWCRFHQPVYGTGFADFGQVWFSHENTLNIKNYSCFSYEPDDPVIADACGPRDYRHFRPQVFSKSFPYVKKEWISEIRLFPELFHKLLVISILED